MLLCRTPCTCMNMPCICIEKHCLRKQDPRPHDSSNITYLVKGASSHHRRSNWHPWYSSLPQKQDTGMHLAAHATLLPVCARVSKIHQSAGSECHTHPTGILSFQMSLVSTGTKFNISVLIYPGETHFARAHAAHSTANDLHRWINPALAALYATWSCGIFTMTPDILAVATKLPLTKFCSG